MESVPLKSVPKVSSPMVVSAERVIVAEPVLIVTVSVLSSG